jgi:hypothetical protein
MNAEKVLELIVISKYSIRMQIKTRQISLVYVKKIN